jgi:hypothetical protein
MLVEDATRTRAPISDVIGKWIGWGRHPPYHPPNRLIHISWTRISTKALFTFCWHVQEGDGLRVSKGSVYFMYLHVASCPNRTG